MNRSTVLCMAAALVIAECVATAQTTVTNIFPGLNNTIPDGQPTGVGDAENLTFSGPGLASTTDLSVTLAIANGPNRDFTGIWAPDGRNAGPEPVLDTDAETALLGSFNGTESNGVWTLFLSDVDFGEPGTSAEWGLVISAIPEPSAWALMGLGGLVWGVRFLRRRRLGF